MTSCGSSINPSCLASPARFSTVYLTHTCFHGYSAKTGVGDGVSVSVCVGRGVCVRVGVRGGVGVEVGVKGKELQPINIHIKMNEVKQI
jgi:hypothetical protein